MTVRASVACPATQWTGYPCHAWGAPGPHGCQREPGHTGSHVCPCGRQFRKVDPPEDAA